MNALRCRQLKPNDDLSAATGLLIRFFREEGFNTPDPVIAANVSQLAALETCGLFVAIGDGQTIAVATVSLEFGIEYGWSAEMGDLYVVPEWRGRGVSRALLAAVENFLTERGAARYQVTVTPQHHHDLTHYYEALGFESEGRLILFKKLSH